MLGRSDALDVGRLLGAELQHPPSSDSLEPWLRALLAERLWSATQYCISSTVCKTTTTIIIFTAVPITSPPLPLLSRIIIIFRYLLLWSKLTPNLMYQNRTIYYHSSFLWVGNLGAAEFGFPILYDTRYRFFVDALYKGEVVPFSS